MSTQDDIVKYAKLAAELLPAAIAGITSAIDGYNAAQAKIAEWLATKTNPTTVDWDTLDAAVADDRHKLHSDDT